MRKAPNPTFVNYDKFTSIGAFGPVMQKLLDPGVSWKDVEWVRSLWKGPMILKGILHPEEARQAQALGIDAVVVSNHGGRQYDSAISGIRALAPIVDAVGGQDRGDGRWRLPAGAMSSRRWRWARRPS